MDTRPGLADFRLQRMGRIYDEADGRADVTHRHDYYTVLLVEEAAGTHYVDYVEYAFAKHETHFVSPGQAHRVALSARPTGCVLTFTDALLARNNIPRSFISDLSLFRDFGQTPPLPLDDAAFARLRGVVDEMEDCLAADLAYGERAIGALLQLFLIYCSNSAHVDGEQISVADAGVCVLRDFKRLVSARFREWHKVHEYADEIHLTPKHLSETVKKVTGKGAKEHIQDRIILEAKVLLLHTDQPVKAIAYELGFEEPLHFSSFFKNCTGVSPTGFRESGPT